VVGGCGTLDWRKGPDIFLQVAAAMVRTGSDRPPHFVWIGGDLTGRPAAQLRFDAERLGVSDIVHFVGATPDTYRYMSIMNVFFLSSREDPFPVVCLEAASLAVPSMYFAESGGMREFVGTDANLVVPYLDVAAAADAIRRLATMPNLLADLGREAKAKVASYSIDGMATRILDILRMVARQAR
jgi:glycosyltransferase involved in cell wall biosynthesis